MNFLKAAKAGTQTPKPLPEPTAQKFTYVIEALDYLVSQGMYIEHLQVEQSYKPDQHKHHVDVVMTLEYNPALGPNEFMKGVMQWLHAPPKKG